ncbi:MAG: hypothetical protein KGZ35_06505 [Truepera sp.]|nr:hypothetical protein [Truepera sp.]
MDEQELAGWHKLIERSDKLTAAGVPYTGDPETDAVLNEHPDILERLSRLERGEEYTLAIEELAERYGIKL